MIRIPPLPRRDRPRWKQVPALLYAYIWLLPMTRLLQLFGQWPSLFARAIERVAGSFGPYRPGSGDVLICSYFKSGTNWALQISTQIAYRGEVEFQHIHDLVPWAEMPARLLQNAPIDDDSNRRHCPTGLKIIKTHLPADCVPFDERARYLCIVRDPKDVFVSGYFFTRAATLGPLMPSVKHWLASFLSEKPVWGSWSRHLAGYWQMRERPNVLFLTYEQMKEDLPKTVDRISHFLGVTLTTTERQRVIGHSSFAFMKSINHRFDPVGDATPSWARPHGAMMRKGERGGARELLSAAQQQCIDDYCRGELSSLGCDFPYDDAFS